MTMQMETSLLPAVEKRSTDWASLAAWVLLVVGLVLAYEQNFVEMWIRWFPLWHSKNETLTLYDRGMKWWVPLLYPLLFLNLLSMVWTNFGRVAVGRGIEWKGRTIR